MQVWTVDRINERLILNLGHSQIPRRKWTLEGIADLSVGSWGTGEVFTFHLLHAHVQTRIWRTYRTLGISIRRRNWESRHSKLELLCGQADYSDAQMNEVKGCVRRGCSCATFDRIYLDGRLQISCFFVSGILPIKASRAEIKSSESDSKCTITLKVH